MGGAGDQDERGRRPVEGYDFGEYELHAGRRVRMLLGQL